MTGGIFKLSYRNMPKMDTKYPNITGYMPEQPVLWLSSTGMNSTPATNVQQCKAMPFKKSPSISALYVQAIALKFNYVV